MPKYYRIQAGNQEFYSIIEQIESNKWTISVGGKKSGCVLISVKKEGSTRRGLLERVGYDERCNLAGDMRRAHGTITMMNVAITIAFENFKDLKEIELQDHSYVNCNDTELYLPPMQILEYGKTWYERKIGAVLVDKNKYTNIYTFIEHIKHREPWEQLWKFIEYSFHLEHREKARKEIHAIWKNTESFKDMILYMRRHDKCHLYVGWLHKYFTDVTSMIISDEYYVVTGDFFVKNNLKDYSTVEIENNPFIYLLDKRSKKERNTRLDIFSNFTPRKTTGSRLKYSTRYTHGKDASLNDLIRYEST